MIRYLLFIITFLGAFSLQAQQVFPLGDTASIPGFTSLETCLTLTQGKATDPTCEGSSDGLTRIAFEGGYPPYKLYTNISTSPNLRFQIYDQPFFRFATVEVIAPNLSAGNYYFIVVDANGCVGKFYFDLNFERDCSDIEHNDFTRRICPRDLSFEAQSLICPTECIGSVNLIALSYKGLPPSQVLNPTPPFTATWNDGYTGANRSNMCSGLYTITYSEPGCVRHVTGTVGAYKQFCNPCKYKLEKVSYTPSTDPDYPNGSAEVKVTPPDVPPMPPSGAADIRYDISWSNSEEGTTANKLSPGDYAILSIQYRDYYNNEILCFDTLRFEEPCANFTARVDQHGKTTFGNPCGGSAEILAEGGSQNYEYYWNNVKDQRLKTGLCAGKYYVKVIDIVYNCVYLDSIVINPPDTLPCIGISIDANKPSCPGKNDGNIKFTVVDGTGPYTFLPSVGSPVTQSSNIFTMPVSGTGLAPGTYSIKVYDYYNCFGQASVVLNVASQSCLIPSCNKNFKVSVTNNPCISMCNGAIALTLSAAYTDNNITWNTGAKGRQLSNLCSDKYSFNATIPLLPACSVTASTSVGFYSDECCRAEYIVVSKTNSFCADGEGCTGTVEIAAKNGLAPYTILWAGGATTFTRTKLCPGDYPFTITDAKGCKAAGSIHIGADYATCCPPIGITSDATICKSSLISLYVSGGTGYHWYPDELFTDDNRYSATPSIVIDKNTQIGVKIYGPSCTERDAQVIIQVANPDYKVSITPYNATVCDYVHSVDLSAVIPPEFQYKVGSYKWTSGNVDCVTCLNTMGNITGTQNSFTFELTDVDGCVSTYSTMIRKLDPQSEISSEYTFCQSVNVNIAPDLGNVTGNANKASVQWTSVNVPGYTGIIPSSGANVIIPPPAVGGNYQLKALITDENGCKYTNNVTVKNIERPIVNVQHDPLECESIEINALATVSTGTGFRFEWSPISNLSCNQCPNPKITLSNGLMEYKVAAFYDQCEVDGNLSLLVGDESIQNAVNNLEIIATGTDCKYRFEALPEGFISYKWDFGDMSSRYEGRIKDIHYYGNRGKYLVQLEVQSPCATFKIKKIIQVEFEGCNCHE